MKKSKVEVTTEQLVADFKAVVSDAEALLKATANQGGDELAAVRAKAEESLSVVKSRIADQQMDLMVKTREAAATTDAYVHEHPWAAVGVAAGLGLLIGMLGSRR